MTTSSGKAPAVRKAVAPVSSLAACPKRNEGDWRTTLKTFVEEVGRLRGETDALESTRADLEASWQSAAEKMERLSDENRSSHEVLRSCLDEERQRVLAAAKEKEDLLVKLKDAEEECALKEKEVARLAEAVEAERIKHSVSVALHERTLEEKEAEYQAELYLREKRIEEMQQEMNQQLKNHEAELLAKDNLLEEERIKWEAQREVQNGEVVERALKYKGMKSSPQRSPELLTDVIDNISNKNPMTHLPVILTAEDDDDADRNVLKKSRLEAARQQRRKRNEKKNDNVTLMSLNKLNCLQEKLRF